MVTDGDGARAGAANVGVSCRRFVRARFTTTSRDSAAALSRDYPASRAAPVNLLQYRRDRDALSDIALHNHLRK